MSDRTDQHGVSAFERLPNCWHRMPLRRSQQQIERECACSSRLWLAQRVTPLFWWPSSIIQATAKAAAHASRARHSSPWQHTRTHLSEHTRLRDENRNTSLVRWPRMLKSDITNMTSALCFKLKGLDTLHNSKNVHVADMGCMEQRPCGSVGVCLCACQHEFYVVT